MGADEVNQIIGLDEGHFADLKAIEVSPSKLSRSISAFANADGGELYIGVDESSDRARRTWRGFSRTEDANGHIQAFESIFPLGQYFSYEFLRRESGRGGYVLHVNIQKSRDIKRATDGHPYVRRGAQNIAVKTEEALDVLRRNKGITSFETETTRVPLDFVTNSEAMIEFMISIVPIIEPEIFLRKQLLIDDGKPTVAATLLFSDEPQAALPKRSAIKIYRYKTTDIEGSRENLAFNPITIEGGAYRQIYGAVSKVVEVIEEIQYLGPSGLEQIQYPIETLHEIITNAVLHRDYGVADDVHIRIFDNRVEIESPGRLPAHITAENILRERYSRNGNIVRWINKFPEPPNKDVGEGLNTAFAAMKKLKLKDPIIRETDHSVLVEVRHQKLASPEQMIMEYLENFPEITNKRVRELTGIGSENKVKSIFIRLADRKQIERVPGKGGGAAAWRKYTGGVPDASSAKIAARPNAQR
ncbi:ATP-binding protein [Amycolatopsis magusensis]|uniref:ATP-dependent DNA helicase RecG n=1 Tax=Amycolatopsis magusensis TaxID=882444 RepID=A0ABS4PKF8_9PSEU|nr:ATP-binding protein [Amycolatopsis magusensis]MBP2179911.1 ATP-dependent DNA helicase RecG [Amycolatopsis magusensis]